MSTAPPVSDGGQVALQDLLVQVQLRVQFPQVLVHRRHQHAHRRLAVADLEATVVGQHRHHQHCRRRTQSWVTPSTLSWEPS